VTDAKNDRVQKFTPEGVHLATWGSIGDGIDQFFRPRPVEVTTAGLIIIGDMDNHRVKIHNPDLSVRRIFGEQGIAPGQFAAPHDFAVGEDHRLYVVDYLNSRVQVFTLQGKFLFQFGGVGPPEDPFADGHFVNPLGMTMDPDGNLFVTDTDHLYGTFDRIQKFSPEGEWLASFAQHGSGWGELSRSTGIVSDAQGRLYVADTENNRITIWARQSVAGQTRSFSSFKSRFGG
jgi:tripartite motif-containing protein 71